MYVPEPQEYGLITFVINDFQELLSWKVPYWNKSSEYLVLGAIMTGELPERPMDLDSPNLNIFDALWTLCNSCWRDLKTSASRPTSHSIVDFLQSPMTSVNSKRELRKSQTDFQFVNPAYSVSPQCSTNSASHLHVGSIRYQQSNNPCVKETPPGQVWTLVFENESPDFSVHFDKARPFFPSANMFKELSHAFLEKISAQHPFLHWPSIFHAWENQTMSPTFANSLIALSFRFVRSLLSFILICE